MIKMRQNQFHIHFFSPGYFSKGVFNGAGQILRQNGLLVTYGVRTNSKFI